MRDLQLLLESSGEGVCGVDRQGCCSFINKAAALMLGYQADEAIGRNIREVILYAYPDGSPYPETEGPIFQAIHTGRHCHIDDGVLWRKNGTSFPAEFAASPVVENGDILGAVVKFTDITRRKGLEEQLLQSQKMDAVGRLAGGVAHDFNNMVAVIMGYSERLLRNLDSTDPRRRDAEEIQKASYRAATLTRQLLAFSRKQVFDASVLDLNQIVTDMERMIHRLIGEDIECETVTDPSLGCVKADPGQIEQVLMNLVVNARDAMPAGGKLTIQTSNITLDEKCAHRHPDIMPGDYVTLSVSDNGTGMSKEVQARLFEPFFTTKPVGKGTGLGLATCYGIIKQSGGHITVESEPGCGTTFRIYLPCCARPASAIGANPDGEQVPRGTETILFVEDEPTVRALGSVILGELGYSVLTASNGVEALELVQQPGGRNINLLVTDVVMPQMSGRDLTNRLAETHPLINVLFTSGYTQDVIVQHGVTTSGVAFLAKPFTTAALGRKVREVLDGAAERRRVAGR